MSNKKGFTLVEIIVVLIIVAVLCAIAIPNYMTNLQQGAARAAQNNLIAIYNAEKNIYLNSGNYCINTSPSPCDTEPDINTNLSTNISDTYFNYKCLTDASGFSCTATSISNNAFKLTVINNPIVLPGGSGTLNPSCTDVANPNYCPS